MRPTVRSVDVRVRHRQLGVAATSGTLAVVAAGAAPDRQGLRHFDHVAYSETIRRVRDGEGLYEASIHGLEYIGASVDQARAIRQPWIFAVWALVPEDALRWSFFVVVALGAAIAASRLARQPEVGVAVGAWVAVAGVYGGVDAWLIFELWTVPLVLACCVAWIRGHDWAAAACALAVVLLRETAVLLPIGFFVSAWWQRRPLRPWVLALAAAATVLVLHWRWAQPYLDPEGRSASLIGTGGLEAVAAMTSILGFSTTLSALSDVVGLGVWSVGVVLLWRSALRPALPLALIPALGLAVNRPYWGFLAMPLCITALGGLPPWPDHRATWRTRPLRRRPAATTAP